MRVQVMRLCLRSFVSAELMRAILLLDFCLWAESSGDKAAAAEEEDDDDEDEGMEDAITPLKPVISSRGEEDEKKKGERGMKDGLGLAKSSSKDLAVSKRVV